MSDVATEVAIARGAHVPDASGSCCWTVAVFPATLGAILGLYALVIRIHEGAGSNGAEEAGFIFVACMVALWICWHVASAGAWLGLPILIPAWVLMFAFGFETGEIEQFFGMALFFVYYGIITLVRGQQPFGIPFLLPLLVVGPMVVFSSWFWWDAFGIAGWGSAMAAVPLGIVLLFLGGAAKDVAKEQ